jgi:hypothetical protein
MLPSADVLAYPPSVHYVSCLGWLQGPKKQCAAALAAAAARWRHWGQSTGAYAGHEPTGETIEMYGMAIATVTDSLQVGSSAGVLRNTSAVVSNEASYALQTATPYCGGAAAAQPADGSCPPAE